MRIRRVGGIAAVLLASACSLESTGTEANINLTASVDKAVLPDGEVMTITLTAQNIGYDPLTLTGPSDCLLYVEILNTQGAVVYHSYGQCVGQTVTETILPGEDMVQSFTWTGSNLAGARLPLGFYHIRPGARLTGAAYQGRLLSVALE